MAIRNELNIGLRSLTSNPFEFRQYDNKIVQETHRRTFEVASLFRNPNLNFLIRKFAKDNIEIYLRELKKILLCDDYEIIDIQKIKFSLRIRVIEDVEGYHLAPHRDSPDTIFSFIMQLSEENPTTCTYKFNKTYKTHINKNLEANELLLADQLIRQTYPNLERKWQESQFGKNQCCWSDGKLFFKYEKMQDWLYVHEFSESDLMTKNFSIYAIHNVLPANKVISSSKYKYFNDKYYHGVPPTSVKSRRLMLMDLIAQPTDQDVLNLEGVKSDDNCYFVLFSPQMNKFFQGVLAR